MLSIVFSIVGILLDTHNCQKTTTPRWGLVTVRLESACTGPSSFVIFRVPLRRVPFPRLLLCSVSLIHEGDMVSATAILGGGLSSERANWVQQKRDSQICGHVCLGTRFKNYQEKKGPAV